MTSHPNIMFIRELQNVHGFYVEDLAEILLGGLCGNWFEIANNLHINRDALYNMNMGKIITDHDLNPGIIRSMSAMGGNERAKKPRT